jgi:hypothetical protein
VLVAESRYWGCIRESGMVAYLIPGKRGYFYDWTSDVLVGQSESSNTSEYATIPVLGRPLISQPFKVIGIILQVEHPYIVHTQYTSFCILRGSTIIYVHASIPQIPQHTFTVHLGRELCEWTYCRLMDVDLNSSEVCFCSPQVMQYIAIVS